MKFHLPMPPSINHYWKNSKNGTYLSKEGRVFRAEVIKRCRSSATLFPAKKRLAVTLTLHANSNRRYDVDNRAKAVLDALEKSNVYADDSQIDRLIILRGEKREQACCVVNIEVIR